jgi:hypothetical protein
MMLPLKPLLLNSLKLMLALKLDLPSVSDSFKKPNNGMDSVELLILYSTEFSPKLRPPLLVKKSNGKDSNLLMELPLPPPLETSEPMLTKL